MSDSTPPPHDSNNDIAKQAGAARSLSSNREAPSPPAPSACDNSIINSLSSNITEGEGTNLDEVAALKEKYSAPNRIVDWNQLKSVVDNNLGPCNTCKSTQRYLVEQKSACFAVTIAIHCPDCEKKTKQNYNNVQYKATKLKKVSRKNRKEKRKYRKQQLALNHKQRQLGKKKLAQISSSINRTSNEAAKQSDHAFDHEVNIRAALAAFYTGTGGYDIGSVASFFGFPGGRAWERTFHRHSALVHKKIMEISSDVMKTAFKEEVVATIKEKLKGKYTEDEINKHAKKFIDEKDEELPDEIRQVGIAVSYDMGWNKRSTGRIYDSLSGHGFIIGCRTGKVIGYGVSKKKCAKCRFINKNNLQENEAHLAICNVNSTGSSGAMESQVALELTIKVFNESNGRVYIEKIVSDDDSSMRAHLQNQSNDDKGKLPEEIPEPIFKADPSHRIKVMSGPIFKMVTKTKDPSKCKQVDALRVKKYTGCSIYKNKDLPIDEFIANAKAPIEHLFNDHQWCHEDWCWAKGLDKRTHEMICKIATQKNDTVSVAAAAVAAPTHPPTATTTIDDGVQMPSIKEVTNPAVCIICPTPNSMVAEDDTVSVAAAAVAVPTHPPTTTTASDDGVQMPPSTEVANPAVLLISPTLDTMETTAATVAPLLPPIATDAGNQAEVVNPAAESSDDEFFAPDSVSSSDFEDDLESIGEDEKNECNYVQKFEETYNDAANMFAPTELDDLRKRELALMERNEKGYYRSKVKHAQLYGEMSLAYQPYITKPMLRQLQHPWSTQKNEAMNQSVASYAPKGKTYSLTNSLDTRVAIAGCVQILGYLEFWSLVFAAFDIELDDNLRKHLRNRDSAKMKKRTKDKSIKGKKLRSKRKYEKLDQANEDWLEMQRTGVGYQTGMAVQAKKNLPRPADRNPKGTPKELLRCVYYPTFCNRLGHRDARSKQCGMHGKSAKERVDANKSMLETALAGEMSRLSNSGEY